MINVFHQQYTQTTAYAALALGCVQLILLVLSGIIGYAQHQEDVEAKAGKVEYYDQALDKPASFYMPPGGGDAVAAYIGNSSSVHSSAASQPQVIDMDVKDKIADRLRAFYAKYDPQKDLADVEDVSTWAAMNSLSALNDKLKKKYGADLDTVAVEVKTDKQGKFDKLDI
jgi:hypothetical protein